MRAHCWRHAYWTWKPSILVHRKGIWHGFAIWWLNLYGEVYL